MAACTKKIKDKRKENNKTVKKDLHRKMIMYGGEGENLHCFCGVKNIEPQILFRKSDEIRDNEENS